VASVQPYLVKRTWFAIAPDGGHHEVDLIVGPPTQRSSGDWAVRVSLGVVEPRPTEIYGVDSWQAMNLGMRFIGRLLESAEKEGWQFYWNSGGERASPGDLFL